MQQLIGLLIFTVTTGLVAVETIDTFESDSPFIQRTFAEIHQLHEIREYKHEQYAKLTNSKSEDFRTPYHLTSEDLYELEGSVLAIFSRDYKKL